MQSPANFVMPGFGKVMLFEQIAVDWLMELIADSPYP